MHGSAVRVGVWVGASAIGAAVSGLAWATQPVEIPLGWVLLLTFVPSNAFIETIKSRLDSLKHEPERS